MKFLQFLKLKLRKKSSFPIIVTVALLIVLAIGILAGWWTLSTILSYIPEVILVSIVAAWIWAYRDRFESWIRKEKRMSPISLSREFNPPKDNFNNTISDLKRKPPLINEGIHHYEKRSDLSFDEVVAKAEKKIEMSAVTFRIITLNNYKALKGLLSRKVSITFLLLKPDSKIDQSMLYHGSKDLKEQIEKSLEELCKLKRQFNELVNIRLYDSLSEHSIIIIDRDDPVKSWMQVELHVISSDSNSRPINVAYEKDNEAFFYQYSKEYETLLNDSQAYECLPSKIMTQY